MSILHPKPRDPLARIDDRLAELSAALPRPGSGPTDQETCS